MLLQAFRKIAFNAGVVLLGISFADEDVNVNKSLHLLLGETAVFGLRNAAGEINSFLPGLPSRSSPPNASQRLEPSAFAEASARQSSLRATAASKDWSLGDSNP